MNYINSIIVALCAVVFVLSTGCIGHMARGVGDSYSTISGAKDRDHVLTHGSDEETAIRMKIQEYTDKYSACIDANHGRSEPCRGYADLVAQYSATVDRRYAPAGMDPAVQSIVFENLAVGRWEDWGQNRVLNRHEREISKNSARIGLLEEETAHIWDALDRIETESREWDEVYDASHRADIDAMLDELDELGNFIDAVDGGLSADGKELSERLERLENEINKKKGGK